MRQVSNLRENLCSVVTSNHKVIKHERKSTFKTSSQLSIYFLDLITFTLSNHQYFLALHNDSRCFNNDDICTCLQISCI